MIFLIDHFDSFTYNIKEYLFRCGLPCEVISYAQLAKRKDQVLQSKALVLSPGPGTPKDYPHTLELLQSLPRTLPVLGICLGHQAMGVLAGVSCVKAKRPVHGHPWPIQQKEHNLWQGIPNKTAFMRYHSLVLKHLPKDYILLGQTEHHIMAMEHKNLPWVGFQFHPESVGSPMGLRLLQNWADQYVGLNSASIIMNN